MGSKSSGHKGSIFVEFALNNLVWELIKGVWEYNMALGMSYQGVWDKPLPFLIAKEAKCPWD